jgi:cell division septation protein DedD
VARRSTQSKELVRLSPFQFSMSVSIIVVLLGAAGLVGYHYGMKRAAEIETVDTGYSVQGPEDTKENSSNSSESDTAVTFYSALTEPRQEPAATVPSASAGKVTVPAKVVEPDAPKPGTAGIVPGSGSVILQIASYKDNAPALKLLSELMSEGYSGTVVRADLGQRGIWYRVRIGPYSSEKDANAALDTLRRERKLKGFIVK